MATTADNATETKAQAAVQKAYAEAAQAPKPAAAKAEAAKIDKAVVEVKAAPKKTTRKAAKKPPVKKAAIKKSPRRAVKAQPAAPKAAAAPKRAGSTISQLKDKIMANTQTTDFTQAAKTAAAEAQTRAKAAFDKLQAYAGDVTEFTKGNVEALVESGKILGAGVQDIARSEVEAAKNAFETATADLKAMAGIKNPTDLFKLQGEIARRNFDALVARTSKNAEVSMKLANDAFAPISSRMSLAAERLSNAA